MKYLAPAIIDDRTPLPNYKGFHREIFEIDMQDLKLMNSAGIRNWVNWLKTFEAQNEIRMVNCNMIFLNIAAFVQDVASPQVKIESVILRFTESNSNDIIRILSKRPASGEWQIPASLISAENDYEFDGILTKSLARLRSEVRFIDSVELSQISSLGIEVLPKA